MTMTMSSAVDALVRRLPQSDDQYASYEYHRALYTQVENVRSVVPRDACPPLPVIIYAIRNILALDPPLLERLPSLLQLLAHLESVRTYTVEKLRHILRLDEDYASQEDCSVPILADEDRQTLEALTKPGRIAAQRTVYRKIVDSCCLLHIHHLWRTFNPEKHDPLPTYLIAYFPAFFQDKAEFRDDCAAALETHPWLHGITASELEENARVGEQAVDFMVNAAQYMKGPERYCDQHGHAPTASFDDVFPAPDWDGIRAAILRFINMVQPARSALESILDDQRRRAH